MKRGGDISFGLAVIFSVACLIVLWLAYTVQKAEVAHYEIIRNYILVAMILAVLMTICFMVSALHEE